MRAVDRALAFVCAATAVFALSFAAGRLVGPLDDAPAPRHGGPAGHGQGDGDDH